MYKTILLPVEAIERSKPIERADLIVSSSWAHTRLAELIYGGVTKTMFNNQKIPVLFAH